MLRGRGESRSVLRGRDAPQGCGRPAGQRGACTVAPGRAGGTARAQGAPQGRMGASQAAWGRIPGRAGHRRARQWHRRAGRDTPGRTGAPQGAWGHRRPHGGTAGRTGTPQAVRGHPRAQGGASKQSVCGRKKGPPAAARRGQNNLFLLREKNFKFFGKNS